MYKSKKVQPLFSGVLITKCGAGHEGKIRADETMEEFLNSREMLPQAKFPFAGSEEILLGVFDVINRQVFNGNLDGIKLEWCDILKSQAVVAYEQITYAASQTYIRCSTAWFKNRNRQNFVEAILYELIQVYVQKSGYEAGEGTSPDLLAYLMYGGLHYFNTRFETNLTANCNYKSHNNDIAEVRGILETIMVERRSSIGRIKNFAFAPRVKLLSQRITGNKNAVMCNAQHGCGGFCYGSGCPSAAALRQRYLGANIYFLFDIQAPQCFLCEKNIKKGTLNAHFNNECKGFGRSMANVGSTFVM